MDSIIIQDDEVKEVLDKASELTDVDYSDYSIAALVAAVEDLTLEYGNLKNELDDYKQEVNDHYRPLTRAEEVGYCPSF